MNSLKFLKPGAAMLVVMAVLLGIYFPASAQVPLNDDVATPEDVTYLPYVVDLDTTQATSSPEDPYPSCNYGPMEATVWYRFTPTEAMQISVSTYPSSYTTVVGIYTGGPEYFSEVACQFNPNPLVFQAEAGVTYYFEIGAYDGGWYPPPGVYGGSLHLDIDQVLPPANDNFSDATIISALPFYDSPPNSQLATLETGEPMPYCTVGSPADNTLWYSFTPLESRDYLLNGSSGYSLFAGIYTGFSDGSRIYEQCWWNSTSIWLEAGQTYFIQVGSMWGDLAWLSISLDIAPDPTASFYYYQEPYYGLRSFYFGNTSYDPACPWGCWASSLWDFGDGTTSGDWSPWHQFASDGDYLVRLTVTTTDGRSASAEQWISVVTPLPVAGFDPYPYDPSTYDNINFWNNSYDPACYYCGQMTAAWDFGDGATSTDWSPYHRYEQEGDYEVQLTVTTVDGRSASTSRTVAVRTHNVAITKFTVPQTASVGQTRSIVVDVNNTRYPETVEVQLYKSTTWGWQWVGSLVMSVPVRPANRTTAFKFSYTFTAEDATMGKINFRAVAVIQGARDALPMDNEAIALPTKVNP